MQLGRRAGRSPPPQAQGIARGVCDVWREGSVSRLRGRHSESGPSKSSRVLGPGPRLQPLPGEDPSEAATPDRQDCTGPCVISVKNLK